MLTTEAIQGKYSSLSPDEQQNFKRKVIYKLINENYGDRVSHFDVDKNPKTNSVASGSVTTPKLGGQSLVVDYAIGDDGVTLTPRNLSAISHGESQYYAALSLGFSFAELGDYVPLETYNFAKTLNCVKGWACGGTCLSKTKKNCLRPLDGEHKTYFDWLKTQVSSGAKIHEVHQEEADKLGLGKASEKIEASPKATSKTKANPEPQTQVEPIPKAKKASKVKAVPEPTPKKVEAISEPTLKKVEAGTDAKIRPSGKHEDLPSGASEETVTKAMSQISGLSQKESQKSYDAIRVFTGSDFAEIRRQEAGNPSGKYKETIKAVNNYLNKAPKFDGQIYRGLTFEDTAKRNEFIKKIEQNNFKNNAMSSFSSSLSVSDSFSRPKRSVIISVKNNKSGVSIRNISAIPKEDEVLCPKDVQYKVLSKRTKNGVVHIEVEEI